MIFPLLFLLLSTICTKCDPPTTVDDKLVVEDFAISKTILEDDPPILLTVSENKPPAKRVITFNAEQIAYITYYKKANKILAALEKRNAGSTIVNTQINEELLIVLNELNRLARILLKLYQNTKDTNITHDVFDPVLSSRSPRGPFTNPIILTPEADAAVVLDWEVPEDYTGIGTVCKENAKCD